ncbi:hypothetical protein OS493_040298 [Desmophyllum pertusum]|uniref:Uncharacterized protein n=1 Tax=Desmophyllum pertusum TaxID=174260 RepID=A0A9W9Z5V0_9CNID|nr:hypothetical protein OS493_040298 [Desmophyllum pertusum]
MECDPVEHTYISQGTPDVTTDTDSDTDMDGSGDTKSNMARWASLERIREETRIVVLDFLGTLPADKLSARNFTRSENRTPSLARAMGKLSKSFQRCWNVRTQATEISANGETTTQVIAKPEERH